MGQRGIKHDLRGRAATLVPAVLLGVAGWLLAPLPARAQLLASPSPDALALDGRADPLLALIDAKASPAAFRDAIAAAVARAPETEETAAGLREAQANRGEARGRTLPSIDFQLSRYDVVSRAFANDPNNVVERSRAHARTDAVLSVTQPLFDFGARSQRLRGARAGVDAAQARGDAQRAATALDAVQAWEQVFGARLLVRIGEDAVARQKRFRGDLEQRVAQGVNARGDLAQADSARAAAEARLTTYRRTLANAEARYRQLTGRAVPDQIEAVPAPSGVRLASRDAAGSAALHAPAAMAAEASAGAADREARAARADLYPTLSGGVTAGRYGVIENDRDYDVRAQVQLRWQLFGGLPSRADAAQARADGAAARARRVREQAARDAEIAWDDVAALEAQLAATRAALTAAHQTRDVLAERFRVSRGDLFELLSAEDRYAAAAADLVQTSVQLDAARWSLAEATGRMLPALGLEPLTETRG